MVFEITMEDDFFEVTDEDGETLADDETEGDIVDDSETAEEKVTSSDGLTLTAALVDADVETLWVFLPDPFGDLDVVSLGDNVDDTETDALEHIDDDSNSEYVALTLTIPVEVM